MNERKLNAARTCFADHLQAVNKTIMNVDIFQDISIATQAIIKCFNQKQMGRVFIFGNGGSAADAQHLAAEFTNRFTIERKPLPMIALTTDTSALTAISNDYSFRQVFSKQLQALARKGDVAIGISTSGNSENVTEALKIAKEIGGYNILMAGKTTQQFRDKVDIVDLVLEVDSTNTARIQECHILIGHTLCQLIDDAVVNGEIKFENEKSPKYYDLNKPMKISQYDLDTLNAFRPDGSERNSPIL